MSDILEFPNQQETFIRQAIDAYQQSQLSEAILKMEKALQVEDNKTLYPLYLTLLLDGYEWERADQFIEQHYPTIEEHVVNVEIDTLYIRLLIELWALEKAEKVITHRLACYQHDVIAMQHLQLCYERLQQQQKDYEAECQKEREQLVQMIQQIDTLPYYQQQQLVPQLRGVDSRERLTLCKQLVQSAMHPMLKAYVLELLLELTEETVDMLWFEQKEKVNLKDCVPILDHPLYQACLDDIENMDSDVTTKMMLQQHSLLYISLLYPFPERVIKKVADFLQALCVYPETVTGYTEWFIRLERYIHEMSI